MISNNLNFLDYLKDDSRIKSDFLEDIKYDIDNRFYQYGNHFRANNESIYFLFKQEISELLILFKGLFKKNINIQNNPKNIAISSAYFEIQKELLKIGYDCINVPWLDSAISPKLSYKLNRFKNNLKKFNFSQIDFMFNDYINLRADLKKLYSQNKIQLLILPQDMGVFERMSIRIFKELNKKSYIFSHGLPGRYNIIDDNKTDFLVVWGKKIKENYVNIGFVENKILVSGHPFYKKINISDINLKSSLDNILVLSKSLNGTPHSMGVRVSDRTNLLLYLYQIKDELIKLGVKSVKFRSHPSENIKWYYNYIDTSFFIIDTNESIINSFNESTLVIGPTSTMFVDSILNNVNYLIYEPTNGELDLNNFPLVPPFDSSDNRVVISKNTIELCKNLQNIPLVDPAIILDYIQPEFDISFLTKQKPISLHEIL